MNKWTKIITYQRTGRSHASKLKSTQDSIRDARDPEYIAVAVADGVGSLPNSKYAADAATSCVLLWIKENHHRLEAATADYLLRNEMIPWIQTAIRSAVAESTMDISSMDCNLAFVCIHRGGSQAVCGSLGDSAVCIFGTDDQVLSTGVGLATGSYTLLASDASANLRSKVLDLDKNGIQGFLVTTDGLENRIYWKDSAYPLKAAEDYFNAASREELEQLVCQLPPQFDDDISIGILSRAQEPHILADNPKWLCTCGCRNDITRLECGSCKASFYSVYSGAAVSGDLIKYFRLLNQDKTMEYRLLHMTPGPASEPEKTEPEEGSGTKKKASKPQMQFTSRNNDPEEQEQTGQDGQTPLSGIKLHGITSSEKKEPADDGAGAGPGAGDSGMNAKEPRQNTGTEQSTGRSRVGSVILAVVTVALLLALLTANFLLYRHVLELETRIMRLELYMDVSSVLGPVETEPRIPETFREEDEVYTVSSAVAYIWAEPNTGSKDLVTEGTYVILTGESRQIDGSTWVAVRSEHGHEGWCRMTQLERVPD